MATRATAATSGALEAPKSEVSRDNTADQIIKQNLLWGAGAGVIPIPILDAAATAKPPEAHAGARGNIARHRGQLLSSAEGLKVLVDDHVGLRLPEKHGRF